MNIVSTIMQLFGPAIISRIASSLGVSQGLVESALGAAVPGLLAGLTKTASQGAGATQLSNAVAKQDTSILSNLGNLFGGPKQQALADQGTNVLSSLLGGSSTNALANAIGKFSGLSGTQGGSLLGMLAPVVLGQLGQVQKSSGLDAGGLANFLDSQKDNIASALPAGFSNLLGGTGLLEGLGNRTTTSTVPVHKAVTDTTNWSKWLIPAALAVLALWLLSSYGCERERTQNTETTAPTQTTPMTADATLVDTTTKALNGLTTTLSGITDEASAKAAVPQLQDIANQIESVKTAAAPFSAETKRPIASLVANALPGITAAIEKATGIPGVAAILNPILQPLLANLQTLSKT